MIPHARIFRVFKLLVQLQSLESESFNLKQLIGVFEGVCTQKDWGVRAAPHPPQYETLQNMQNNVFGPPFSA